MHELTQNLRFAVRTLAKSPGFTAVALTTLALGIGANTAIFSVVDAVLLRPLSYADPSRLVAVFQTLPRQNVPRTGVSYLNYSDFAARARSFRQLGAIRMHDYTLTGQGEPELVVGGTVTSNVFALFQVQPLLGRVLTPDDDPPGAPPVAVLGERLWRDRFASDPRIVGKTVALDKQLSTIVGEPSLRHRADRRADVSGGGGGAPGGRGSGLLDPRAARHAGRSGPRPALRIDAQGFIRVMSEIQFASQVFPPSSENDCSKCAELAVMSDHT